MIGFFWVGTFHSWGLLRILMSRGLVRFVFGTFKGWEHFVAGSFCIGSFCIGTFCLGMFCRSTFFTTNY